MKEAIRIDAFYLPHPHPQVVCGTISAVAGVCLTKSVPDFQVDAISSADCLEPRLCART